VFLGWYKEDNGGDHVRVSGDERYTFTVSEDRTLIARFAPESTQPPDIPITDVTIAGADNRNLTVGQTLQLTANISPANATNQAVIWTSSNASVATVSDTGQVTAVSVGTAVITVRTQDGDFTASVTITVTAPLGGNDGGQTGGNNNVIGGDGTAGGGGATGGRVGTQPPTGETVQVPAETPPADVPAIPPTPAQFPFTDVALTAWYYRYVRTVWENALFQGTAQNIFSPQLSMTRAMFAQALANLEGADTEAFTTSSFNDVSTNAWYFGAVEWAVQEGFIYGVGNGNFAPNAPITREQMAVMLYRYAEIRDIELRYTPATEFIDQASISAWAVDGVRSIQGAGIVIGRPDGGFHPQETATRSEVSAIFARFLDVTQ